jgi:hypothetical protein
MKHLACTKEMGNTLFWSENLKGRDYVGGKNLKVRIKIYC